jgi:hypothetical protein
MSSYIFLPCGCRLSEAYVLGMCPTHADEIMRKKVADEKVREEYRRAMLEAVDHALEGPTVRR